MSVLAIIFAILGFIISPFGLASIMVGLMGFLLLPALVKPFRVKWPTKFYQWLATMPITRAAIVVSEHNDAIFKQMEFDAIGVEKITLDDETKDFEDPDKAFHYWSGISFALADEKHGMLFDPRHAAIGKKKHESDKREESFFLPTEDEWNEFSVSKWMKGVFAMPREHELVDLSHIRELADGGERAEHGNRVEQMYKNSQDPFNDSPSITKFLYPAIGFMITFGGIWVLASQLGTGGAGAGDVVAWGTAPLLAPVRLKRFGGWLKAKIPFVGGGDESDDDSEAVDVEPEPEPQQEPDPDDSGGLPSLRTIGATLIWLLIIGGVEYGLFSLFGLTITVAVNLAVALGFLFVPILSFMFKPISMVSGMFSKLFMRLAFMGYQEPVFYWTPRKYVLREFSHIDDVGDVKWYNLFGTQVGFSFPPTEDSWDAEVMDHSELEELPIPEDNPRTTTDGGSLRDIKTNIPKKFARTEGMNRDRYGAFIPRRIRDTKYYLHTARALERFKNSANGEKSHLRLQEAKEKHGGAGDGMNDNSVLYLTAGMSFLGAVLGVWFFIL